MDLDALEAATTSGTRQGVAGCGVCRLPAVVSVVSQLVARAKISGRHIVAVKLHTALRKGEKSYTYSTQRSLERHLRECEGLE